MRYPYAYSKPKEMKNGKKKRCPKRGEQGRSGEEWENTTHKS
jgi:hypothetical protein